MGVVVIPLPSSKVPEPSDAREQKRLWNDLPAAFSFHLRLLHLETAAHL
jgi:hypothetical protein